LLEVKLRSIKLESTAITGTSNGSRFYCNAGCLNDPSEFSYTEGIDFAAEQWFCAGIATKRIASAPNQTNAFFPGNGRVDPTSGLISPLVNYPVYDFDNYRCDPPLIRSCSVLLEDGAGDLINASIWNLNNRTDPPQFPSFGVRGTILSYPGHYLSSDEC
jgi:hypothetical protein